MAQLERVLSFRSILIITINSVMGTGIFFLPAIGAAQSGSSSFIAWVIMGIVAMYISMVFAELVGMYPESGGVYEFCKQIFSPELSFMVGFITIIVGYITIAMLVVGAVSYIIPTAPLWLTTGVALCLVLLFHGVAYRGMEVSAMLLVAFGLITMGMLLTVIVPSLFNIHWFYLADMLQVCTTADCNAFAKMFATVFLVSETFFGWETTTFLAGETKDGARVVPKALIIGTAAIVLISWVLVIAMIGAVGSEALAENTAAPLSFVATTMLGDQYAATFALWVYLAIIGSVAGWVVSAPRLINAMAEDKLFIQQISHIHKKFNTPANAIIFQGVVISLLIIFSASSYERLLHLLVPLVLLQYGVVILIQVLLRYKKPDQPRTFTIPGPHWLSLWVLPLFVMFVVMWVLHTDGAVQILLQGASLVLLGLPILLLLKVYYDPDFIIKLNDFFAWFVYLTEKITFPEAVRKEILLLTGDIHGKRVLEYGCGVGTLTVRLAEKTGTTGKIYATNISKKELSIARQRIERRDHEHVVFIHDTHQVNRIHPHIPEVDVVLSFGMLSHIQDLSKVLREMNALIGKGGKICMVDYSNYFHVIPDVDWLTSDQKIRELFRECGFSVNVTRKKGKLWNYVYIHGMKASHEKTDAIYV